MASAPFMNQKHTPTYTEPGNETRFLAAAEAASCYFGLNAGTSCIAHAYERPDAYVFVSAAPVRRLIRDMRHICSVSKATHNIEMVTTLSKHKVPHILGAELEVPWQYRAATWLV